MEALGANKVSVILPSIMRVSAELSDVPKSGCIVIVVVVVQLLLIRFYLFSLTYGAVS